MTTSTIAKPRIAAWSTARVLRDFSAEIERRGGAPVLHTIRWAGSGWTETPLSIRDRDGGLVLLGAGQWHQTWRKAPGRFVEIAYLCGWDDNGLFAAAVPGTTRTVADALRALTPAEVTRREHVRQGDVYLVRMERAGATTPSGVVRGSHVWDAETRTLTHAPADGRVHAPVTAPDEWPGVKVVEQNRHQPAFPTVD
ncbi:hypothetical protein [Nocardioides sp. KR10-350]|uniref:hypothetical protein n=1 Tax=Nocardioides cheoyonin TaxID=3156615 RepID=UPI0032B47D74